MKRNHFSYVLTCSLSLSLLTACQASAPSSQNTPMPPASETVSTSSPEEILPSVETLPTETSPTYPLRQKNGIAEKQGVYYEVFVRAFADSDGDGIGDFNGLTSKLDYLKELGIDGLWLMPINASPSYHGYDVTDYESLNSDYGTEEDFKKLLDEAHKRDIKVIMDFVVNHTSKEHPWFQSAINEGDYQDFYHFKEASDDSIKTAHSPWNTPVWHPLSDSKYYYGVFSDSMPDLNYENPNVRQAIKEAASKWLKLGVDGFRLDAAVHIYGEYEYENLDQHEAHNLEWWNDFARACEAVNPNVYLVGEAWDGDEPLASYVQPFDTKFNFTVQSDLMYAIKNTLSVDSHGEDLASSLQALYESYDAVDTNYLDGVFASNHDQNRIMSDLIVPGKVRLLPHIYLTLPGNPYIYYGEELGMKGNKPDELIRLDFKWTDDYTNAPNCNWSIAEGGQDYHTINEDVPSLAAQKNENDSIYNLYKTLIELRKTHEALSMGQYEAIATQNPSILGYRRYTDNEDLVIFHNLTSKEITLDLSLIKDATCLYHSAPTEALQEDAFTLPGYSTVIYKR